MNTYDAYKAISRVRDRLQYKNEQMFTINLSVGIAAVEKGHLPAEVLNKTGHRKI
jgi:hypothetical protein